MDKKELAKLFNKESYQVALFKQHGFRRSLCPKCRTAYWSLNSPTCGDTLCVGGYQFLGRKIGNWSFADSVDRWTKFFQKNGHTPIKEYPVVARWRDDMFFTIASIADFQPWVVDGVVDPPANPLTVAQPCLRFNDIDNVGRTGRHFSLFTMGGQHAFGLKNYWMDRCIELNFGFLTEVLKLRPEQITYREDVWAGGGNFGPSLESFAEGLEIVNSVFMQYKLTPEGPKELSMRVIDVGWGLERVCWFANGTPTAYDPVFGDVIDWMKKETKVAVDEKLLQKYSHAAGLLNVEEIESVEAAREAVAAQLGMKVTDLDSAVGPFEALYAIADHMRALVFAITDGALPSNVGGGYNLRNLLRRSITLNKTYGFGLDLKEICRRHIKHLSKAYPRLKNASAVLDELLPLEESRYTETLDKGKKLVLKLIGTGTLDADKLVELYDSQGITPEMVSEIASEHGKTVEVPGDFYARLDARHEKEFEVALPPEVNLPPTKQLYYDRPHDFTFTAKVLSILDGNKVVLDQTLFYPTSGGQLHDTGTLNGIPVVSVEKSGNAIVHVLERPLNDRTVKGTVNPERRATLNRHHTATHIINYAARTVLGNHIWQNSAFKGTDEARLDITHFRALTENETKAIEEEANAVVLQDLNVNKEWMERDKAEQKYGFTIYQGGVVPGKLLRIISINGKDTEACSGIHVDRTSEVGPIVLLKSERIQDGAVRLRYIAGPVAVKYLSERAALLDSVARELGVAPDSVPKKTKEVFERWKELRRHSRKSKN